MKRASTIIYSNNVVFGKNKTKKNQYCSSFSLQITPTAEEIGHCDEIRVSEIGGTSVTIFKQGTVWVTYCSAINVLAKT